MKKSILPLLMLSCLFSNNCLGAFTSGGNDRSKNGYPTCFVDKSEKDFYHCRGIADTSWGNNSSCADTSYKANRSKHDAYGTSHGGHRAFDGTRYICCRYGQNIGFMKHKTKERFITKVITKEESKTTNTDGSITTCWVREKYTVCSPYGGETSPGTPEKVYRTCNTCKAPTTAYRNGECVEYCGENDSTMAYASKSSNECISCETTAHQGIIEDDNGYNVCQKCNPETELFIDSTGCVKKSEMVSYDKKAMRDCWMAENSAQYNCCMQLGKTYLDEYKKKTNKEINKSNHFNCCLLNGNWNNNSCTDGEGKTINLSDVE